MSEGSEYLRGLATPGKECPEVTAESGYGRKRRRENQGNFLKLKVSSPYYWIVLQFSERTWPQYATITIIYAYVYACTCVAVSAKLCGFLKTITQLGYVLESISLCSCRWWSIWGSEKSKRQNHDNAPSMRTSQLASQKTKMWGYNSRPRTLRRLPLLVLLLTLSLTQCFSTFFFPVSPPFSFISFKNFLRWTIF